MKFADSHGATLLLPGGLGAGGAAAGSPPTRYLIDPPSGVWNSPYSLTLWIEPSAVLVAGSGVRSYLGGPLRTGAHQIFDTHSHPLPVHIRSNGTNATVTLAAGAAGFKAGDRIRVSGASQPDFNGFYSVFSAYVAASGGAEFSFQMAQQPDPHDTIAEAGGAPVITFAAFYFGQQKPNKVLVGNQMSPIGWCAPEWWGALPADNGIDATAAVQFALDSGHPINFLSDYRVDRVTVGAGTVLEGQGHALIGGAKVARNAVLEIKGDMCDIRDLQVHSDFGQHYASAIHWYTNALNVNYVGFNRLRNIQFYYGKIGLLVGAPPTQKDCCSWQGGVVPDGQATNAPLSESNLDGMLFFGCETAIWYRQPNGFLEISNSVIGAQNNEWPSGTFGWNSSAAIQMHHAGSLNIVNSDLESVVGAIFYRFSLFCDCFATDWRLIGD